MSTPSADRYLADVAASKESFAPLYLSLVHKGSQLVAGGIYRLEQAHVERKKEAKLFVPGYYYQATDNVIDGARMVVDQGTGVTWFTDEHDIWSE